MTVENIEEFKNVYFQSAAWVESARDEYKSIKEEGEKKDFFALKYMGILIYNDLSREYYNLEANPTSNISRLLAIGPVIHKLFEAHLWYKQEGNKKLRELAILRGILEPVDEKLRVLRELKATRIEAYKDYRDKFAGHYDVQRIELIETLGTISFEDLREDAMRVIRYGNEWLGILKYVGLNHANFT